MHRLALIAFASAVQGVIAATAIAPEEMPQNALDQRALSGAKYVKTDIAGVTPRIVKPGETIQISLSRELRNVGSAEDVMRGLALQVGGRRSEVTSVPRPDTLVAKTVD